MADLDDLLLQAAGRTGGTSGRNNNNNNSRRWERSYSDGSSGSEDEDPKYKKSSQVPLKKRDKRSGSWDEDGEDDDGEDSDSAPSVGSDLYKDEADKEELEKMSELDREMILAERSTKIDDYKLKKMARASSSRVDVKRKESSPPLSVNRSRMSTRAAESKTAAKNALNELRAKRMRQQEPDGRRDRLRSMAGEGSFGGRDSTPSKYRAIGMPSSPPSDGSDGERGDDDKKLDDDLLEDLSPSRLGVLKFEDIKDITIRRSKLVKWFMEPFFEELIAGCFVRLGVGKTRSGPRYKLCLVKNVDATDSAKHYKLENYTTYKWLNCVWGNESSAARWQMAMVSDSPPLEDEFREWKYEVEKNGGKMPTRQEVLDKKGEIQKISNFVYSAATVKQMLQEKKMASLRPVNVAAEKDRLRKALESAQSRRDGAAEVVRIKAKLKELEDMSRQVKKVDEKAVKLSEMNKKNRAENFKNASELKPVNTSLKAGEAGYDPFSRRWTRSSNYYLSKSGGDGNNAAVENGSEKLAAVNGAANGMDAGLAATAAALEAAAGAGKLIDTSAPVDQGTVLHHLHNFDIPISLATFQKFGGPQGGPAGFLARKQKIEATIGYKVPDSDGRRHPLTLTVSDYKRRRGLL